MGYSPPKNTTGYISGAVLASATLATISVSTGVARSSDDTFDIVIPAPLTIDITAAGAGGLDVGVETPSTWYAVYVIGDSAAVNPSAGLLSLSFITPALPIGYDKFRRIGSIRNNAGSDILSFYMSGAGEFRRFLYTTGVVSRALLVGGAAVASTAVSLATHVPPSSQIVLVELSNTAAIGSGINTSWSDVVGGVLLLFLFPNQVERITFPTTPIQEISYFNSAPGGSANAVVDGYEEKI